MKLTSKGKLKSNLILVPVAKEQDELDSLIETFKLQLREESDDNNIVNNSFGENKNWIDLLLWMMFLVLLIFLKICKFFDSFKKVWL